jgi:hypothetical protein
MFTNTRGKPITYADWKRVAKRYGGDIAVRKVEQYMNDHYLKENEKVDKMETFLFNLIWKEES